MNERIRDLDDEVALRVLAIMAGAHHSEETVGPPNIAEAIPALQAAFQLEKGDIGQVSDGDLARAALLVYAYDPAHREGLEALLDTPVARHRYAVGTGMAITAAILVVLQTHLRFERTEKGKWNVLVEKKGTDSSEMIGALVKKLLEYVNEG